MMWCVVLITTIELKTIVRIDLKTKSVQNSMCCVFIRHDYMFKTHKLNMDGNVFESAFYVYVNNSTNIV